MIFKLSYRIVLAASIFALSACVDEAPDLNAAAVSDDGVNRPLVNVFETAIAAETFTTLVSGFKATGLDAELADESETFTLFAATDAAFDKLGSDAVSALLNDTEKLKDTLQYHLIRGNAMGSDAAVGLMGSMLKMANGDQTALTHDGTHFYVNTSQVIVTDIMASNGIIHVIDTVLEPPVVVPSPLNIVEKSIEVGTFKVFNQALVLTGLADTLSNTNDTFTVFAPNDEAFAKLPSDQLDLLMANPDTLKDLLLYHVIGGDDIKSTTIMGLSGQQQRMANDKDMAIFLINGKLKVNESNVISTDIIASNGILHEIDAVMLSPAHSIDSPHHEEIAPGSILEIASRSADFSIFAEAVKFAKLDGPLGCPIDIYTVFAPNNSAFEALSVKTRKRFFSDHMAMRSLILAHVLPGRVVDRAGAYERLGFNLEAGNGGSLVITQQDNELKINNANIIATDTTSVNGVLHTIDKVILP